MITKGNIETVKKIYAQLEKWNLANDTLTDYFNKNKLNDFEKIVLIKVVLIDSLYNTNLKDQISVAKHIFKIDLLDNLLETGDANAVKKVAKWNNKALLSFASKFCHFHNKGAYPIYDSYVCIALKKLIGWKNNKDYNDFKQAINNFRKEIEIEEVSFEDIDKYLWLFGLREKLNNGETKINREVFNFYNQNKEMFDSVFTSQ